MPAARLQNAPSWHYVHSDQWRYEKQFTDYHTVPPSQSADSLASGHTIDMQARAVRNGWLPFYPQFNRNPLEVVRESEQSGAKSPEQINEYVVQQLKSGGLKLSVEDPDAPENWPRVFFIWRGNALLASAKGHEYFLKHYLGTHTNAIATDFGADAVREVTWREPAPEGKMDLLVDLNFRMDTSALYSDIILPAATWYEKADLNSTDMHSFIHPLSAAVPPCWESKSDWQIFRSLAKKFSELAVRHFPGPVWDLVASPLAHDTSAEIAQPVLRDWRRGETEAIPGKTMPGLKLVARDYANLYSQFISFGPQVRSQGLGAHGTHYDCEDFYDEAVRTLPATGWNGQRYPSLCADEEVCNLILRFATVTNGELAYRSYRDMEWKVGLPLAHLAERNRGVRVGYQDLQARPQRLLNSPMWSGLTENGRAYAPFTYNVECLVPWRTLTGRQHFYLDHPAYIQFGEHLPTYKPKPSPVQFADLRLSQEVGQTKMLNYLTPHGKWHIHSTYGDNHRMTTLSRGVEPLWINDKDAADIGIIDNDCPGGHDMNCIKGTPQRALWSATLGFFVGFAAVALFGPTANRFQQVMGLGPVALGFLVAAPALSGSLLRIPFAAWVDTCGGRKPFLWLLSLSLVGMIGLTLVSNFLYPAHLGLSSYPLLMFLAILCGCGIATFSVGISQVSYWFPQRQQGRALAIFAGFGNVAPGIFSMLLPVALATLGLARAYLAWLALLAAGTVIYALAGRNSPYFQFLKRGASAEQARALALDRGQELVPQGNLVQSLRESARVWRTWALVWIYFTTFGGFIALTAWLPTYWTSFFGVSIIKAGFLTAAFSILASLIRIAGGVLADQLQEGGENTAILALLITLVGALVMTGSHQFELSVPGEILIAIGMGISNAAVFKIVPQAVPQAIGGAAGWVGGLGAFGGFAIPPVMAMAVHNLGVPGYAIGFVTFVFLSLFSLSMAWILKYAREERPAGLASASVQEISPSRAASVVAGKQAS